MQPLQQNTAATPAAIQPPAGDVDLEIRNVSKVFGAVRAVDNANLAIRRGEMIAFLGPSGCGKSTLLNIIAGFIEPDEGEIWLRGRLLNNVPPSHRETGLVFQHYALFPHMRVAENIGYGLAARRQPAATIRERVAEMISLLKLQGLENRYPAELSGGQRQRVAVARSLAVRPQVLLLDEALSALDKNLREEMQIELSLLLRQLQITTILVTHDQREAFAVGDRIIVMDRGHIVQIGTPQEVYLQPKSSFVLKFLGSANALKGRVAATGSNLEAQLESGIIMPAPSGLAAGANVVAYVRSESVKLSTAPTGIHKTKPGTVKLETFLGSIRRYVVELGAEQVVADCTPQDATFAAGTPVFVDFDAADAHVLSAD